METKTCQVSALTQKAVSLQKSTDAAPKLGLEEQKTESMHKHAIELASQLLYRAVFAVQLEEAEFKYGGEVLRDLSRRLEKALTGEFKAFMSEHKEGA